MSKKYLKRPHSYVRELLELYEPYSETTKALVLEELMQDRMHAYEEAKK